MNQNPQIHLSDHPYPKINQPKSQSQSINMVYQQHYSSSILKYPLDDFIHKYFITPQQLLKYLKLQQINISSHKIGWYRNYKPNLTKCEQIRLRCKKCLAFVRLRYQQNYYKVYKMNNQHNHADKIVMKERNKNEVVEIQKYIWRLRMNKINKDQILTKVREKFSISSKKLCKIIKGMRQDSIQNFNGLMSVKLLDIHIISEPQCENLYPECFMITKRCMSIEEHPQVISFFCLKNVLSNKSINNQPYKIGFFLLNKQVLSIIIYSAATPLIYKQIFVKFLQITKANFNISAFITQYDLNLIDLFKNWFQFQGSHIIDSQSIISQLQSSVKNINQNDKYNIVNSLKQMLQSTNKNHANKVLDQIKQIKKGFNIEYLDRLLQLKELVFFAYFKPNYCGLSRKMDKSEIDQLFTKKYKNQSITIFQFFQHFSDLLKQNVKQIPQLNQQNTYPIEKIFKDPYLKQIREYTQPKVINLFLNNFIQSLKLKIQIIGQNYIIENILQGKFIIKNSKCECQYKQKTGIPCSHLLVYLRKIKQKYINYIDVRWIQYQNQI